MLPCRWPQHPVGCEFPSEGVLSFAQFGPWLVLGTPAGVLVDRLNRTTVMVSCDVARALLVAAVLAAWLAERCPTPFC